MRNVILFDTEERWRNLLPLTFTRPIADLRVGIITLREKWERRIEGNYSYLTQSPIAEKFRTVEADDTLFIASHVCPDEILVKQVIELSPGESLWAKEELIAFRGTVQDFSQQKWGEQRHTDTPVQTICMLYDIFLQNGEEIERDFELLTTGRTSQPLSPTVTVIGDPGRVFVEAGSTLECVSLNVTQGSVYIGGGSEIMEGSHIRAPFATGEYTVVNMGTKIYGATTLGPHCKVGGELNNVVMIGYSNKGHDGFLGNAVIGEWCNLGAGCTASNLKNDYTEIKLWNYAKQHFLRTGLQFCGLIMGDHSKAGVNTMFNTGTVIGVGVNVYGAGFPRNFVPSFSEGGNAGFSDVSLPKFFAIAEKMMERRNRKLTELDRSIFEAIFHQAENYK